MGVGVPLPVPTSGRGPQQTRWLPSPRRAGEQVGPVPLAVLPGTRPRPHVGDGGVSSPFRGTLGSPPQGTRALRASGMLSARG